MGRSGRSPQTPSHFSDGKASHGRQDDLGDVLFGSPEALTIGANSLQPDYVTNVES